MEYLASGQCPRPVGRDRKCRGGSNRRKWVMPPSAPAELAVGEAGDGFRAGPGVDRGSAPTPRHAHARGTPHPTDPGLYRDGPVLDRLPNRVGPPGGPRTETAPARGLGPSGRGYSPRRGTPRLSDADHPIVKYLLSRRCANNG